jgi:Protein of unknown function (DUF3592)
MFALIAGLRRFWSVWSRSVEAVLLYTGVVLLCGAGIFWAREWARSRSFEHATATVTEMESRQDAQGNVAYFPHVRFRLPNGEIVQVVSAAGGDDSAFGVGEVVPVAYRAGDPRGASIATKWRVYSVAIVLGILGTVVFDLGAVLWIMRKRGRLGV